MVVFRILEDGFVVLEEDDARTVEGRAQLLEVALPGHLPEDPFRHVCRKGAEEVVRGLRGRHAAPDSSRHEGSDFVGDL